ncbi:MAG: TatD family hydrolase [Candidatus Omnitrophica bacterium]|nr:TatD family hydrolase [Candidatus Omnitrophota bacterium]
MLIDTHCHIQFPQFDADRPAVFERARAAGVGRMVVVGADAQSSAAAMSLAAAHAQVTASAGIHPHRAALAGADECDRLRQLVRQGPVAAIGEIGLDFYDRQTRRAEISAPARQQQEWLFREQLAIAVNSALPVIVHCRQAHAALLAIIRESAYRGLRGVMHCFSGDCAVLEASLSAGWFISYAANITYPSAAALRDAVVRTPLERLLLESDAPYLAPQGGRGARNEPAAVKGLAIYIAELKGIEPETVIAATAENAGNLFGWTRAQEKR